MLRRSPSLHDQPTQALPTLAYAPDADDNQYGSRYEDEPSSRPRGGGVGSWVRRLLFVLLALVLGVVGAALLLTPTRHTVLILGSDARPDELARGQVGRTDSLMVLLADRAQPKVGLISVPRDLWVPIPGHGEERINTAYVLGGDRVARQAVGSVLGLPIDRYAMVGLQGVRDVVDAVGGVEINVAEAIHDPAYPTDDYGTVEVHIPAGRQHMDGETALRYARTRHQDSDFGRIARQQQVLAAVRSALMQPTTWPRLPAVLAAVQRSIKTDLSPLDTVAIAAAFLRAPGEPDRLVVDTALVEPYTGVDGASLLLPTPRVRQAVARFAGTQPPTVEVLNGAQVAGIARATADRLAAQGVAEIARIGDADRPQPRTTVATRPETRRAAEAIAATLGVSTSQITETATLPPGVDVQVVLGADAER